MTELQLDDGTVVPVNYSLRNTSVGWKVYDVRIEGISYVQNYRSQFNAEISARGIEAVIARLEGGSKATADTDGEGST
jgi:phospholipid transport system substrate-binding protein